MSDLPVLDPTQIQSLLDLGAEPSLVQELVGLYESDVSPRIGTLAAAVGAGDARRVMEEAHQLKGALGNLGLLRFADLARQLELAGQEGCLDGTAPLLAALPGAFQEGLAALKARFPA